MSDLKKKVDNAIKVMKMAEFAAQDESGKSLIINSGGGYEVDSDTVEISYSTGKDSDVILHLAQMSGIKHIPIYKMTSIDPPYSTKHAENVGAVIVKPNKTFFRLIEERGFPTRRARFCCEVLKEYAILPVAVQGIRKSESTARAKRYQEPQICRIYNKKDHVQVFLPILDWTDADIEEFIKQEKIQCHPHYYDEKGGFHVERRVGCMCCPLQSIKKLKADFATHPRMARAYIQHGLVWWNTHLDTSSRRKFPSLYDLFFHNVFCDSYQDYLNKTIGMFGKLDTKQFMEEYFNTILP